MEHSRDTAFCGPFISLEIVSLAKFLNLELDTRPSIECECSGSAGGHLSKEIDSLFPAEL